MQMRRNIIAVFAILFCVEIILVMGSYFFLFEEPAPDADAIASKFTLQVADFHPEPNERKLYMTSVLLTPILCALSYRFLNRSKITLSKRTKLFVQAALTMTPILLFLLI